MGRPYQQFRWRQWYDAWITEKWVEAWHQSVRVLTVERISEKDGITWDRLYEIKNDLLGPDSLAVEVYPPADQLVNECNRRHLWEVPPEKVPLSLRR